MDGRNRDLQMDAEPAEGGANQNKTMSKDLAFVFNAGRDNFPAKPYAEDGNPEFYTAENMHARQELKDSQVVTEAIQDFMSLFAKTGHS